MPVCVEDKNISLNDNHFVDQNYYDEDVEGYMSQSSSDGEENDEHDELR